MSVRIEWVCPECGANGETISEGNVDEHLICTRCGAPVVERVFETGDFKKFASEFRVLPNSDTARIPVKCPECGKRCTPQRMDLLSGKLHCPCGQVLGPMDFDPEAEESKSETACEVPKSIQASQEKFYTRLRWRCNACGAMGENYESSGKGSHPDICPECGSSSIVTIAIDHNVPFSYSRTQVFPRRAALCCPFCGQSSLIIPIQDAAPQSTMEKSRGFWSRFIDFMCFK